MTIGIFGCTSVEVKPIDSSANVKHVCIQENPNVKVPDFLPVLREGFERHGISTEVILSTGTVPKHCESVLTYIALQSWDVTTFLSHAELSLEKDGKQIATAKYHLTGKGGFSLMKWQSTKTKMDPVIDELLKEYSK